MKVFYQILGLLFFFNCSSQRTFKPEFIFSSKTYDNNKIQRSEFYYNSSTGVLRNSIPDIIIVKLNDKDKRDLYSMYKKLKLKSNECWFTQNASTYENDIHHFTNRYELKFTNVNFSTNKCDSTSREENLKFNNFYLKIKYLLQTKQDYKEAFPEEFETH